MAEDFEVALKNALLAYEAKQKALGAPLKDASELFKPEHVIGIASLLETTAHKFEFGHLAVVMSDKGADEIMNWLKQELAKRPQDATTNLLPNDNSAGGMLFLAKISKDAYDHHIRSKPAAYLEAKADLARVGLDTSYAPGPQDVAREVRERDIWYSRLDHLKYLQDPELIGKVTERLLSSGLYGWQLLTQHSAKISAIPNGETYIKQALKEAVGIDVSETTPLAPGEMKADTYNLRSLMRNGDKHHIGAYVVEASRRDPYLGFTYAADSYPKDPVAIQAYLAALPRSAELLNNPAHGRQVIKMLNALEPSQYAGQGLRLIPEKDVFLPLQKATAGQLYDLITQQVSSTSLEYTLGTYNGLLNGLFDRMKSEGKSLSQIVASSPEREKGFMQFISSAASLNRMQDLVRVTTPTEQEMMVRVMLTKDEAHGFDMTVASEFIKALPKNSSLLPFIEATIISRAIEGDDYEKADMGLLSYWYAKQSGHTPSADNKGFFDKVARDNTFQVKPLAAVKSTELLDQAKRNFQLHVFYNDQDGIDSFNSFAASLKADGFSAKKHGDFFAYTKERNGRSIEILISPPAEDGKAVPAIQDYVGQKGGKISMLTGRGHSHHMAEAIEFIEPQTKIVTLGGCWGHGYVSSVLEKSPDAHILSTSGTGRMIINNATSKWLNDQVLSGRDVDWKDLQKVWDRMGIGNKAVAKDLELYVTPDKNVMLNYERKRGELYKVIENAGEEPAAKTGLSNTFMSSVRNLATRPVAAPAITPQDPQRVLAAEHG